MKQSDLTDFANGTSQVFQNSIILQYFKQILGFRI